MRKVVIQFWKLC